MKFIVKLLIDNFVFFFEKDKQQTSSKLKISKEK